MLEKKAPAYIQTVAGKYIGMITDQILGIFKLITSRIRLGGTNPRRSGVCKNQSRLFLARAVVVSPTNRSSIFQIEDGRVFIMPAQRLWLRASDAGAEPYQLIFQ